MFELKFRNFNKDFCLAAEIIIETCIWSYAVVKVQLRNCKITINNISNLCDCLLCDAVVAEVKVHERIDFY